jgi:hypothetical protein
MENVLRIVLLLDLCQPSIVRAISRRHPVALVFSHEVHIGTS